MRTGSKTSIYVEGRTNLPPMVDLNMIRLDALRVHRQVHGDISQREVRQPMEPIPSHDMSAITWGSDACPICGEVEAAGGVSSRMRGEQTGITLYYRVECPCYRLRIYQQTIAAAKLPVTMRGTRLATLTPTDKVRVSVDRQRVVAEYLRGHRDDSFLLTGARRSGKSHLAAAIFGDVVVDWIESGKARTSACPAIIISAERMISEWMDYNRADEGTKITPTVTEDKVAAAVKAGMRPVLIIEDLDRLTKFTEALG